MDIIASIRRCLKKIFPLSAEETMHELGRISDESQKDIDELRSTIIKMQVENSKQIRELNSCIQQVMDMTEKLHLHHLEMQKLARDSFDINKKNEAEIAQCSDTNTKITTKLGEISLQTKNIVDKLDLQKIQYEDMVDIIEKMRIRNIDAARNSAEAVWAWIYNNTLPENSWLKDRAFSPGRWAMGYPNLYVLFRVLNEIKPKRILELGLGQSSKMVGQYVSAFEDTEHLIIEHDQDWINFFSRTFELPARSQIIRLEREMVPYKEADAVRVFKGFEKVVHGKIFDLILIDAPLGGDMKQYARIDVLEILPACLAEDFMILLDDYERIGEQHTVKEIEMALKDANIPYKRGKYSGKKDCIVIVSESLSFLTSM